MCVHVYLDFSDQTEISSRTKKIHVKPESGPRSPQPQKTLKNHGTRERNNKKTVDKLEQNNIANRQNIKTNEKTDQTTNKPKKKKKKKKKKNISHTQQTKHSMIFPRPGGFDAFLAAWQRSVLMRRGTEYVCGRWGRWGCSGFGVLEVWVFLLFWQFWSDLLSLRCLKGFFEPDWFEIPHKAHLCVVVF